MFPNLKLTNLTFFWKNVIIIMETIKKVSDNMITINKDVQSEILMTTMEEIVPQDSLFHKVDKYIDFIFIYDEVKDLYCSANVRHSIDSVVFLNKSIYKHWIK